MRIKKLAVIIACLFLISLLPSTAFATENRRIYLGFVYKLKLSHQIIRGQNFIHTNRVNGKKMKVISKKWRIDGYNIKSVVDLKHYSPNNCYSVYVVTSSKLSTSSIIHAEKIELVKRQTIPYIP